MSNTKVHSESPTRQHPPAVSPQKKLRKVNRFYLGSRERYIVFNTDFDSGNIECIKQLSEFQYRLGSVPDNYGTVHEHNSKGWFFFSVTGFPKDTRGRFYIERVQTLLSLQQTKLNCYRPVCRLGEDGQWQRLPTEANLFLRQNQTVELCFEYLFKRQTDVVYFAFCYPFSYGDNIRLLQGLSEYFYIDQFYYHQQVMVMSPEGRSVHLLTISSHDQKDTEQEIVFDTKLFPENNRPLQFRKPVVLITARVHPAETAASHAMVGVLKFLTSKTDLRAYLLRQMFVFMVVPMINVDGVFRGHFRMDTFGNNLNRHYLEPDAQKHPAVYAIKSLAEHLNKDRRLTFYFDLHAHNAKKGCFFYGNAINDFVDQVESQVFCKLFAQNCKHFEYESCNFSMKHMKARDRFEDLTKEGCGRVVMHKLTGIIHSFSLECGLISSNQLNQLPDPCNSDFKVGDLGFERDPIEANNDAIYNGSDPPFYTPQIYQNVGKNLLVSILDTFDKNPYNRVYSSELKTMQMLRRTTAFDVFHNADRFRMFERFTFNKVKNINELMKQNFKVKFDYNRIFNFHDTALLKNVQWPTNVPGLCKEQTRTQSPSKRTRRNDNLYTGNSEEDHQNDFINDILVQLRDMQSKELLQSDNTHLQKQNNCLQAQTSDCFHRQQPEADNIEQFGEGQEDDQLQALDSEQQSPEKRTEIGQTSSSLPAAIHTRSSKRTLINLQEVKTSGFMELVVPDQRNARRSYHHPRRDLRMQHQKRKMSRKQFEKMRQQEERIEKAVHHNNFKIALLEETIIKDGSYSLASKMYSNLRLTHIERSNEATSKEVKKRSDSLSKPKKMELITVKLREFKRHSARLEKPQDIQQVRLPQINQDKLYPYATAHAFLQQQQAIQTDLNEMFSNTLKFEALRMKEAVKCMSRQRG